MESLFNEINDNILKSDMLLFGIGDEAVNNICKDDLIGIINQLSHKIEHTNYFIVATFDNGILRETELNQKRVVYPNKVESNENEEKQWELYNKWLSATMGKNLLIMEMGEGFRNPQIIRWPFETVAMINYKAKMYRIHNDFSQIPKELQSKAVSVDKNAYDFLKEWLNYCE